MKKILNSIVCFALFFGCQTKTQSPSSSQELRLNIHSFPANLDPRKAGDSVSAPIMRMCFEGLTRVGLDSKPHLAIAKEVKISPDQTEYLFILRDALWSDGEKVTAFDFEKTWKKMLDPTFACPLVEALYKLKNAKAIKEGYLPIETLGVTALSKDSLKITLEHPVPYFFSLLATQAFYPTPTHIVEHENNWTQSNYVGNGPFQLIHQHPSDGLILVKNLNYWDATSVKLEKVHMAVVEDLMTELSLYEEGQIDWVGYPFSALPDEALPTLFKKGKTHILPLAGTYYYIFNTKTLPFNNLHLRKAFSLAINRKEIVDHLLLSEQLPALSLIPPILWDQTRPLFKDADIAEARRLFDLGLEEMGLKKQDFPKVCISYNTISGHHKIAQVIQQQWQEAFGIRIKLKNKEWKVFLDELNHYQFQIARMGLLATYPDPSAFLEAYTSLNTGSNLPRWTNPEFSNLLNEANQTSDQKKRDELLAQAEKILIDEMPIAPIYFYTGTYMKKDYVKDVYLSELSDIDLKWAYLDK